MKKTTPQKLSNRLAQYSALAVAIAGVADATGQIVYTDVSPDIGGAGVTYLLDMDNDGTPDFTIRNASLGGGFSYVGLGIKRVVGNSILGITIPSGGPSAPYYYPFALSSGAVISSLQNTWISNANSAYQTMSYNSCLQTSSSSSQWCSVTDKYLGLRFKIGFGTHYGWARLNNGTPSGNWVIKDYAYNSLAGQRILAGQGLPLSIDDNELSKIKIVALNKSIALFNLPQTTNYKLFTMTGQTVLEGEITNNTYVIEANTLATGVYIIELQDDKSNAVIRKKIVL